jgi:mRNA interferase MazF
MYQWQKFGKIMPEAVKSKRKSAAYPKQGEVWWVNLDPTIGQEINKRRPCLIVSPNEMNEHLSTVLAAPITSTVREWPTRVKLTLQRKPASVALDQMRALDKRRLDTRMTTIDAEPALEVLREMFAQK